MRILVINPNTSESVTDLIAQEANRVASPGTDLIFATAQMGMAYIETRLEALIGGYATACIAAERHGTYDGLVVAAFGDPGLLGIKELCSVPVVGMTEAALASSSLLGQRFSIIAISSRIKAWYLESVERSHLTTRLASIRTLQNPLRDIGSIQDDYSDRLKELAQLTVNEDGADSIILAGAPLAGLARKLKAELPVPVVDGVSSAVKHCESLIALEPGIANEGSFTRPPLKPNKNLPENLASMLK